MLSIKKWWQCCHCSLNNSLHSSLCQACFHSRIGMFKSLQYDKNHQLLLLSGYIRFNEFRKLLGFDIYIMILSYYNEIIEWMIDPQSSQYAHNNNNNDKLNILELNIKPNDKLIYGPKANYYYGLSFDLILKKDSFGNITFIVQLNSNSEIKSIKLCVSVQPMFGAEPEELIFFSFIDVLSIEHHNNNTDNTDSDIFDVNVSFSWEMTNCFFSQNVKNVKVPKYQTDQLYMDVFCYR